MIIERTITAEGMPTGTIRIELTRDELWLAYCEQDSLLRREDAENRLCEYCEIDDPSLDKAQRELNALHVLLATGSTYENLIDPEHPAFILDDLVERFNAHQDSDLDENTLWQFIIDDYFKERHWRLGYHNAP